MRPSPYGPGRARAGRLQSPPSTSARADLRLAPKREPALGPLRGRPAGVLTPKAGRRGPSAPRCPCLPAMASVLRPGRRGGLALACWNQDSTPRKAKLPSVAPRPPSASVAFAWQPGPAGAAKRERPPPALSLVRARGGRHLYAAPSNGPGCGGQRGVEASATGRPHPPLDSPLPRPRLQVSS